MLAIVWLGDWPFTALVLVTGILILREWNTITKGTPVDMALGAFILVITVFLAHIGLDGFAVSLLTGFVTGIMLVDVIRKGKSRWMVSGLFYACLPVLALIMIRTSQIQALQAIVFILVTVWVTDSAAYFAGRAIGGPKLWPSVSPNKTWAGLLGGMAGAAIAGGIFAWATGNASMVGLILLGAVLALVSQGGDLFESSVKRRFNVKDSGNIIPGHGGIMDRVDGLVAAAVFAAIVGASRAGFENVAAGILQWN